jgi:Galactose mutarotase and related enzymes
MGTRILENDFLRVTIADAGAELSSVVDKQSGRERIWTADPSVWNRHAPILFPFVGKVTDGKYRVNGREYAMKTQHGFARDMTFACPEESAASVTHTLTSDDQTREIYPFDFRLTVRHRLDEENPRRLIVEWSVENTGDSEMLFSIGGHPGFLMPEGQKKEDCCILFPGRDSLQYFGANAAGFALPDEKKELKLDRGCAAYQADIPDTWIFEDQGIGTVQIAGPDRKPYVTMECAQFPMLAVWANSKGPYICLEPWFGRTDDAGFCGTLEEKKGMEKLKAGGEKEISYSMELHA